MKTSIASFGSSVQHVAFATDNRFSTAEAPEAVGFEALPMPENCYDDLGARLGLEPDLVKRPRAGNFPYDEDADGACFQTCSRGFGNGIFFEMVQREGSYRDNGAPNGPFRIAAQKGLMPLIGRARK